MRNRIEIKFVKKIKRDDLIQLYREAGWWKSEYSKDPSFIDRSIKNSFLVAGAFRHSKMIGMARCLSDGVSDAYILDLVVLKKYRGKGVGKKIMLALLKRIRETGIDWITVIAEPGTEKFYKKLGFKVMRNFVPLKLK